MYLRHLFTLAAAALVCAGGCGSNEPFDIVPVSGTVTLNGKPAEKVTVLFTPIAPPGSAIAGPASMGVTDGQGHFTMKTVAIKATSGAVVGKHKVRITNYSEPWDPETQKQPPKPANPIPEKYGRMETNPEFSVPPGGTSKADFALTGP